MTFPSFLPKTAARWGAVAAMVGAALFGTALAANTDLANAPLFTSSNNAVKPNIMFILDDSGSMAWDYLPDAANISGAYSKFASQCNGVAYNPAVVYTPPVNAAGTSLGAASLTFISFNPTTQTANTRTLANITAMPSTASGTMLVTVTAAARKSSWYSSPATPALGPPDVVTIYQGGDSTRYFVGTVQSWDATTGQLVLDLTAPPGGVAGIGALNPAVVGIGQPSGATYYRYTGAQPRLSYTYTSAGVIKTTNFYKECASPVGSTPGSSVFSSVNVTAVSAEAQNYANWYQYYRTRMTMMKSSISLAFKNVDSRYRLGYSTISATTASVATEGNDFLDIADFTTTQKASFYTAFNAASTAHWTPLRGALSKAGQYYAKKALSQTIDPVQYSCQRNFTILSTDGYWNTPEESASSPYYGPYRLDNTTLVGQQDGSGTLRPMLDGNSVTTTTTSTWTSTSVSSTTTVTPVTSVTTSTRTTSTYTPTGGTLESDFTLPVKQTVTLTRPAAGGGNQGNGNGNGNGSTYTVVATTSSNHNLGAIGTTATAVVAGGTVAGYTGTFTVTITSATGFTYDVASYPAAPGGTYTIAPSGAQSCAIGQGVAIRTQMKRDTLSVAMSTLTLTTTSFSTVTAITTKTDKTPYYRVVTQANGLTTSDSGPVAGILQSTTTTTTTTSTSALSTTTGLASSTGPTSYTAWVTVGTSTIVGTCTSTVPATSTASNPTSTTAFSQTAGPPAVPNKVDTSGTGTLTTTGPVTSLSAVATASATVSTGGVSNSLADVAAYYYNTDLRTASLGNCTGTLGTDVCTDNVPGLASDAAHSYGDNVAWQHMTTFTLGLGVSGLLTYDPRYLTQLSGDFYQITNGTKDWPAPGPSASAENIDDLWHAAVNGHGQYFSASDPSSLAKSLDGALDSIKAITGAAAAASTSSLQPVEGDNDIYVAEFTSQKWVGDVLAYKIDPSTGAISSTTTWSASAQLDTKTPSTRTIYYPAPSGGLHTFTYANLTLDAYNGYVDSFCSKTGAAGVGAPTQCSSLNALDTVAANLGSNLVSYLRGDQTLSYYRNRDHVLGDIINASPLFVGKPSFKYLENSYPTFQSDNVSRTAIVLAAANDGMLHAFDRTTGNELWAYMPSLMLPKLYRLADANYTGNHEYFVDGSPQVADIYTGSAWKTIVVGGLNGGGRGYYALDVTTPGSPRLLWEFTNNNLGYSYGNPIITKRADGTWVVVFASGYNNVSPGDGNGHLFVLNANTGALITTVDTLTAPSTPAGTSTLPSGLAKINDWVDSETNNLALRYYGGDLLGNLWRFDIDSLVAPFNSALLLAQFIVPGSPSPTPQSITVKPALGEVTYNGVRYPVVYTATGRYLGTTDLATTGVQSIYAIKDPLTNTPYGNIRSSTTQVTQTLTVGTDASGNATRSETTSPVDWSTKTGWRADFPASGERVNVNPQLVLNTLYIGTNVPSNNACTVGGASFLYKFDIGTGGTATGESSIGTYLGNVLIQGLTTVQLSSGGSAPGSIETILTRSDASLQTNQSSNSATAGALRRTSWRELVN